jgi:hypothetical protein
VAKSEGWQRLHKYALCRITLDDELHIVTVRAWQATQTHRQCLQALTEIKDKNERWWCSDRLLQRIINRDGFLKKLSRQLYFSDALIVRRKRVAVVTASQRINDASRKYVCWYLCLSNLPERAQPDHTGEVHLAVWVQYALTSSTSNWLILQACQAVCTLERGHHQPKRNDHSICLDPAQWPNIPRKSNPIVRFQRSVLWVGHA